MKYLIILTICLITNAHARNINGTSWNVTEIEDIETSNTTKKAEKIFNGTSWNVTEIDDIETINKTGTTIAATIVNGMSWNTTENEDIEKSNTMTTAEIETIEDIETTADGSDYPSLWVETIVNNTSLEHVPKIEEIEKNYIDSSNEATTTMTGAEEMHGKKKLRTWISKNSEKQWTFIETIENRWRVIGEDQYLGKFKSHDGKSPKHVHLHDFKLSSEMSHIVKDALQSVLSEEEDDGETPSEDFIHYFLALYLRNLEKLLKIELTSSRLVNNVVEYYAPSILPVELSKMGNEHAAISFLREIVYVSIKEDFTNGTSGHWL